MDKRKFDPQVTANILKLAAKLDAANRHIEKTMAEMAIPPQFVLTRNETIEQIRGGIDPSMEFARRDAEKYKRELMGNFAELFKQLGMYKEWGAIEVAIKIMAEWGEITRR